MKKRDFLTERKNKLGEIAKAHSLNSILISDVDLIEYFIDCSVESSYLLFQKNKFTLFVHKMFQSDAKKVNNKYCKIEIISKPFFLAIKEFGFFFDRVGFYGESLTYSEVKNLITYFRNVDFIDVSSSINSLFEIADEEQIIRVKQTHKITKKVWGEIPKLLDEKITEFELSQAIAKLIRDFGAEKESFPVIVAFGNSTSNPHHIPTNKKLGNNKIVLIDFGVVFKGAKSDITRTMILSPSKKILAVKSFVDEALSVVESKIKAGIKVADLDLIACKVFQKENVENNFLHSLGHGLGIKVHQSPRISFQSKEELKANQIIAIEPGLYFENSFGVRNENNYLVTETGSINLSKY
ncbi:MAG: M24 family metallopeptidase [Ignavibacteriaceae bacterium]|nr:M24 family metallopeptidase [Ignavibacteriaceae bacterium]